MNVTGLPEIIQRIAAHAQTGTLKVQSAKQTYYIYFCQGKIRLGLAPSHPSILANALQHCFSLDTELVDDILVRYGQQGISLCELVLQSGLVDRAGLIDLCRFQLMEEIWRVFCWPEAFCEFHDSPPPPDLVEQELLTLPIDLTADAVVAEAFRRCEQWRLITTRFPSTRDVPYFVKKFPSQQCTAEINHLLTYVNGIRDFAEIMRAVRLPLFQITQTLYQMSLDGYLKLKSGQELLALATLIGWEQDLYKCIQLYERAEELGVKQLAVMERLAWAYETAGMLTPRGVDKYKEIGAYCMLQGNYAQAVEAYSKVIGHAPEDWASYENLIECLRQEGYLEAAAKRAAHYAQKYFLENQSKAIQVLQKVQEFYPQSAENLKLLASFYLRTDNRLEAILTYEKLAALYQARQELASCALAYREILRIDEENIEARMSLARTLQQLNNEGEAIKEYRRVAGLIHESPMLNNVFNCQHLIEACQEIIRMQPDDTQAREWLVDGYLIRQEKTKAQKLLQELLSLLEQAQNYTALVRNLQKMIELQPTAVIYRQQLAAAYQELGQLEQAKKTYLALGNQALETDDLDTARKAFEALLTLDVFNYEVRQQRAALLERLGHKSTAAHEYELVGHMSKAQGLYEAAVDAFIKFLSLAPHEEKGYLSVLAHLCHLAGRQELAIRYYRKMVNLNLELGNLGEALEACRNLQQFRPDNAKTLLLKEKIEALLLQTKNLRVGIDDTHEYIVDV